MMIVSIGLSLFLRNLFQYFAGAQSQNYSQYSAVTPWEIGPLLITPKEIVVFVLAMGVLLVTTALLQYTRVGKATRAVADNPALSSATGINVERVISIVWIGGAALAGLSGALLGLTQGFDYQIGFKLLLLVFAAVVLGGLGTIWGAIVGAFIIGLFTELTTLFVPAEFKFVGALLMLILVLLVRPQGLLGRAPAGRLRKGTYDMDISNLLSDSLQQAFGPTAIIYCLAAIGLNVHFGYTGLLNFGQAGFMMVAGYALGGAVTIYSASLWLGVLVGILLCVVLALLLGVPTLRLRADYLAIVTIAAAEIIRQTIGAAAFSDTFGGQDGITDFIAGFRTLNPYHRRRSSAVWAPTTSG